MDYDNLKSACLKRAVNCAGSTCFGLHFNNVNCFAKNVFLTFCAHLIYDFSHS